jgi:N-acyl-D-aspartate/D-glutamate deacylase
MTGVKRAWPLLLLLTTLQPSPTYDIILRHGTILDGSGLPRFDGDIGVRGGFIVAIGDLSAAKANIDVDVRGLFVAPGFINIHAHPSPDALPTAVNMLTQGVTTEITNPDGAGPIDIGDQLKRFEGAGLAENIGGYIGFNSIWQTVVGESDRRPTPAEIDRMRAMVTAGLEAGAWGVSAGLDYKPGYFAQTEEVVRVVDVARPWRTNFTNHERLTPETNFSSRVAIEETLAIGQKSGLVPIVTHMKVQGIEQGTAASVLATMRKTTQGGAYTAADAYPYLAGQSGLGALIIPGWAQEGGRPAMLKRFADPAVRARIITEAEQAMTARFGGPQGVYLPRTQQELIDVMKQMNAGAGETIVRILETTGDPGAILRFGSEADLVKILQEPVTSMACDCGASTATRVHPRFYGSFPRLLGRYVREQKIMTWEEAIRKSSALPAATIGMVDRGFLAPGMAADIAVFDPATIIDHATYDNPSAPPEGITHVLVNGQFAVRDGAATGVRAGKALTRTTHMPSRPMTTGARRMSARGQLGEYALTIDVAQSGTGRSATGTLVLESKTPAATLRATQLGVIQSMKGWSSITAVAQDRAITVIVEDGQASAVSVSPRSQ